MTIGVKDGKILCADGTGDIACPCPSTIITWPGNSKCNTDPRGCSGAGEDEPFEWDVTVSGFFNGSCVAGDCPNLDGTYRLEKCCSWANCDANQGPFCFWCGEFPNVCNEVSDIIVILSMDREASLCGTCFSGAPLTRGFHGIIGSCTNNAFKWAFHLRTFDPGWPFPGNEVICNDLQYYPLEMRMCFNAFATGQPRCRPASWTVGPPPPTTDPLNTLTVTVSPVPL